MRYETRQRNEKAKCLRTLRAIPKLSNKQRHELAGMQFGDPKKETLGEHWPFRLYTQEGISCLYCCVYDDDGTAWTKCWLLDGNWSDEEIAHTFGICEYYHGPGRGFARVPSVYRSKHSTLVKQWGGLDV